MDDKLFGELLQSVNEGVAILKGEAAASRRFQINRSDIKNIRSNYKLSQSDFANLLGIKLSTLQNWEQGRRLPHGPARVLLQIAARHPDVVMDVVINENKKENK